MNEHTMHDYFRRQELRMNRFVPDDQPVDDVEALFDDFVLSRNRTNYGFYLYDDFINGSERNWNVVVWISRNMIETELVKVDRLGEGRGFRVTMPVWLANRKGVI